MQRRNVGLRFANPTYAEYFHSLSSGVAQVLGVLRPGFAGGVLIKAQLGIGGPGDTLGPHLDTIPHPHAMVEQAGIREVQVDTAGGFGMTGYPSL